MKGKKSFQLYTDYLHLIEELTSEERGIVFTWIMEYCNDLNPPDPEERILRVVINEIRSDLKRDLDKWEQKCAVNANNGRLGGRPSVNKKPKKTERLISKPKKADKDKDKDKDKDILIPPPIQSVNEYIQTYTNENPHMKFDSTPQKWYDFYQSKGWKIGNNKMKDWKAAVRTWMKPNDKPKTQTY